MLGPSPLRGGPEPPRPLEKNGGDALPGWVKPVWVLRAESGSQTMGLSFSQSLGSTFEVCGPGHTISHDAKNRARAGI